MGKRKAKNVEARFNGKTRRNDGKTFRRSLDKKNRRGATRDFEPRDD